MYCKFSNIIQVLLWYNLALKQYSFLAYVQSTANYNIFNQFCKKHSLFVMALLYLDIYVYLRGANAIVICFN